jgi:deoxyribose-phosphate aldolase
MTTAELARYIDHTLLKPATTEEQIRAHCEEAERYGFIAVCVMPTWVQTARRVLNEIQTGCLLGTTVGFPTGAHHHMVKTTEAEIAVSFAADELDMVINIGAAKSGMYDVITREIEEVVYAARGPGIAVKVILETCLLTEQEKRDLCMIAVESGASFVKTSTGFSTGGATVEDVRLFRSLVPEYFGVKASGGIRDLDTALAMIEAGADRIGTSSGVAIIEELRRRNGE